MPRNKRAEAESAASNASFEHMDHQNMHVGIGRATRPIERTEHGCSGMRLAWRIRVNISKSASTGRQGDRGLNVCQT